MSVIYPSFAVPITWDSSRSYDALKIVLYNGKAYTSKQSVPSGVDISNTDYWFPTGNMYKLIRDLINGKANKATTLAGYGITDAKIANGTITLGNNSITPITQHQDISGKVNKSGDTMSGNLSISTSGNSAFILKNTTIDLTKANNNISSTVYRYFYDIDSSNRVSGYVENAVLANGQVRETIACRNYKTDGTNVDNAVSLTVNKDGTRSISVTDASIWRSALGLGSIATKNTGDYLPSTGGTINGSLTCNNGGVYATRSSGEVQVSAKSGSSYIYLHTTNGGNRGVYTDKGALLQWQNGGLIQFGQTDSGLNLRCGEVGVGNSAFNAYRAIKASAFTVMSSRLVKENISNITDDEAKKILSVEVVSFDYKDNFGGQKNNYGCIAEDVIDVLPYVVNVPEGYDEKNFDETKGIEQDILSVDYSKFVPYLIKMVQIQQREIEELKETIERMKL